MIHRPCPNGIIKSSDDDFIFARTMTDESVIIVHGRPSNPSSGSKIVLVFFEFRFYFYKKMTDTSVGQATIKPHALEIWAWTAIFNSS